MLLFRESISLHIFRRVFLTSSMITFTLIGAGFIDTVVISRFEGRDALAAAGLAYPFYYLCGIVYGCLSTGLKSVASRKIGEGDVEGFRRTLSLCLTMGLLVSVAAGIALVAFAEPVAYLFGARGNSAGLLKLTADYLTGLSIGFPALVMNSVLATGLQFDNGGRVIRLANLIGMAVDVALDLVAVACGWGMLGIGLASTVSAYSTLAILCLHTRLKTQLRFRAILPKRAEMKEILFLGSDRILYRVLIFVRPMIVNPLIIALGGSGAMAALSARNSLMSFVAIPGYGISDGVSVTADVARNMRQKRAEGSGQSGPLVYALF